ncbi:MAG: WD40/YVTN/BNR-like repeat-containing protein [Acidimicrobiales bacterium]
MTDQLLAIGTRKGLFLARSGDDRSTWELDGPHFPAHAVYSIAVDTRRDPARVLAGTHSEHWGPTVFRSDDLGRRWQETEGGAVRFSAGSGGALQRVWQLRPGPADQPDVVWAGAEPGSLFRSDDGGATFSLVHGLWNHPHRPKWEPGGGGQCLHTIVLHPTDPDRLLVAISTGGVYRSSDGGATWAPSNAGIGAGHLPDPQPEYGQCVHKVAAHPERPEQLFLQNHGGVYRSDDGGATWLPIEDGLPAVFGFPVVTHPHRPGTAYLYPLVSDEHRIPPDARVRVYRTADAGESWEPLTEGLPQIHAFSTVLRDAMTTDDATPAGVYFGTRTGDVFASRDEGDTWSAVANFLPDVLVVRAATLA